MLFGRKKIIGLDIGSSVIKLAELSVSAQKFTLDGFAMIRTPPGAMENGEITHGELISGTIKEALGELQTRRKMVATGLWGASVVVKRIVVPRMEEGLLSEQIRWEAEQYIPYDIHEVNIEYKILNEADSSSGNIDILLVAAMQDSVFKLAEVVEMSNLGCQIIDIEGFALANCFEVNYGQQKVDEVIALFNVGAHVTNFVVLAKGEIIFCRDIPVGGVTYTSALHRSMGLSMEEAESLKLSVSRGEEAPEDASIIIESTHEVVLEEFKAALDFFLSTSDQEGLSQVYFSGGGSRVLDFGKRMEEVYQGQRLNPLMGFQVNSKKIPQVMLDEVENSGAIAIGLGLRVIGDS